MDLLGFFLGRRLREDDLHKFTGVVLESKTWSETHVSGGGGGGSLVPGAAVASSSPVSSTVTTKNQFFLSRDDGGELSVTTASGVAVRAGTRLVIYAFQRSMKDKLKHFIAYGNVQTGDVAFEPNLGPILGRILPKPFYFTVVVYLGLSCLVMIGGVIRTVAAFPLALAPIVAPAIFIGLWIVRIVREGRARGLIEKQFGVERAAESQKLENGSLHVAGVVA